MCVFAMLISCGRIHNRFIRSTSHKNINHCGVYMLMEILNNFNFLNFHELFFWHKLQFFDVAGTFLKCFRIHFNEIVFYATFFGSSKKFFPVNLTLTNRHIFIG